MHQKNNEESVINERDNEDNTNKIVFEASFTDWESVQMVINLYAKQNGFVANEEVDPIDNLSRWLEI